MKRPLRLAQLLLLAGASVLASCSYVGLGDDGGGSSRFKPKSTKQAVDSNTPIEIEGRWLAYLASESKTGREGTDFNEDGDRLDAIAVVVDMQGGSTRVLDVHARQIFILGDQIYLVTDEDLDGRDWSGDGFASELVLLHWSRENNFLTFVSTLASVGVNPVVRVRDRLYFSDLPAVPLVAPETSLNFVSQDLPTLPMRVQNGDGVTIAFARPIEQDEGLLFVFRDERDQGFDLNGDGDATDRFVLGLVDTTDPAGALQNVGLAVGGSNVPVRAAGIGPNDWLVGFLVDEEAQGNTNFNNPSHPDLDSGWQPLQCVGLGDTDASDEVLHFLDFAQWMIDPLLNRPVNTGLVGSLRILATPGIGGAAGYVGTLSREEDEGTCSLNLDPGLGNDFDTEDVVFRYALAQAPVLPVTDPERIFAVRSDLPGGASGISQMAGRFLAVVGEFQDGRQYDDDLVASSAVLGWIDPNDGPNAEWVFDHSNGGREFAGPGWMRETEDGTRLLMSLDEFVAKRQLNSADADTADSVPVFARFDPQDPDDLDFPGIPLATNPVAAGIVLADGLAFFRVFEGDDGFRDLNKDKDRNDVLLYRADLETLDDVKSVTTLLDNFNITDPDPRLTARGDVGAAFIANEVRIRKDLNGDGDTTDLVIQWFKL